MESHSKVLASKQPVGPREALVLLLTALLGVGGAKALAIVEAPANIETIQTELKTINQTLVKLGVQVESLEKEVRK